jgi:hypothetical protein
MKLLCNMLPDLDCLADQGFRLLGASGRYVRKIYIEIKATS